MKPVFAYRGYPVGNDGLVIGRSIQECDIVSLDETISRVHARVERGDDGTTLIDLDSTNGVFVNQAKLDGEVRLAPGDLIGLGTETSFHLRYEEYGHRPYRWHFQIPKKPRLKIGSTTDADIYIADLIGRGSTTLFLSSHMGEVMVDKVRGNADRFELVHNKQEVVLSGGQYKISVRASSGSRFKISVSEDPIAANIYCKGLDFSIRNNEILKDISLWLPAGRSVGIFGPSGSGKTTLLKSLAGLYRQSDEIYFGTQPISQNYEHYRHSVGYVPQDDVVHGELTVRAALLWVARLRLGAKVAFRVREKLVDSILEALRLTNVSDRRIGDLSGGQRKRVSIMAELIPRPAVLFLDEPTAGLDPSIEARIMQHFSETARTGASVILTTHILYSMDQLDRVLFLCRGRVVFFGEPREIQRYFSEILKIDFQTINTVFEMLETLGGKWFASVNLSTVSEAGRLDYLVEAYRTSRVYRQEITLPMQQYLLTSCDEEVPLTQKSALGAGKRHPIHFFRDVAPSSDIWVLLHRQIWIRLGSWSQWIVYFLVPVLLGLLSLSIQSDNHDPVLIAAEKERIETMFSQGGYRFERGVLDIFGRQDNATASETIYRLKFENIAQAPVPVALIVFLVMGSMFMGALAGALEISTERHQYIRERQAGLRVFDYISGKMFWLMGLLGVQVFLMWVFSLLRPEIRLLGGLSFFIVSALWLSAMVSAAVGLAFSALDTKGGQMAILFAFVFVLPQLLFMGVLGPQFYIDFGGMMQILADLTPGRWAVSSILGVVSWNEQYGWFQRIVTDVLGFRADAGVYWKAQGVLVLQLLFGVLVAAYLLRRGDE